MATAWETFPIKFEGGWRTDLGRIEQGIQAPGSAIILQNYEPSVQGGYARLKGFDKFSSTLVPGTGNIIGVILASSTECIVRRNDTYYFGSGAAWTSKLTAGITGATKIYYDYYNFNGTDKIIIVDGFEDPAIYNATTDAIAYDTAAPADVTGATLVRVFKNHIFFAKGRLLTFTAPFTDTDYTPANGSGTINVGDLITGLVVFREQLIIFTRDKILRLNGNTSDDFILLPITSKTGCLDPYTIQEVGGDILYMGPDGIRWLSATERNEDFGLERASSNIQDQITPLLGSNISLSSMVIRSKNQYRIFAFNAPTPSPLSEGFLATKYSDQSATNIAWSKTVGIKVYCVDSRQFSDREVIIFGNDSGYVYRMDTVNSFDGANIQSIFQTPYMPINDPRIRKTFYKHSLYLTTFGNFQIVVNLKLDYDPSGSIQPPSNIFTSSSTAAVYGSAIYGVSVYSIRVADTFINQTIGSGFVVSLRYEENSTNPSHNLEFAILEYMNNERR